MTGRGILIEPVTCLGEKVKKNIDTFFICTWQNYTLSYWVDNRMAPREKTLLSVAFYGRSFTLKNASMTRSGAPSSGPGIAGPFTNTPGLISFNEVTFGLFFE